MPRDAMYLAVYDVTQDRERNAVAKALEGYGRRIQFSVFECRLTKAARQKLLAEVEDLNLATGFLYLYLLGQEIRRQGVGKCPEEPFAEDHHAFVI
jgi:CRISPR-associated protein Cas2